MGAADGASVRLCIVNTHPESEWLTVPDVAELLGARLRDVRGLIHTRDLLAVRTADTNAVIVHRKELVEVDGQWVPLPSLRGTVTVLEDAGFTDAEAMEWLTSENSLLGEEPIDMLREGDVHAVRRAAALDVG